MLRLFHINDTHSHIDASPLHVTVPQIASEPVELLAGGYSAIHSFVRRERALAREAGLPTLFLHAGDCFEGSLYFTLFKGRADVALLNRMRVDAMAVGNHEFDRGDGLLAKFTKKANFPLLAANLSIREGDEGASPLAKAGAKLVRHDHGIGNAYIVKDAGGTKVAIFGLSLAAMHDIACPSEGLSFLEPVAVAKAVVAHAKANGIELIILLSHLGIEGDRAVAQSVSGVSLIVGGHTHLLQGDFSALGLDSPGPYAETVNGIPIIHAGYNALAVGMCDVSFDSQGTVMSLAGSNKLLLSARDIKSYKQIGQTGRARGADLYSFLKARNDIAFVEPDATFERLVQRRFGSEVLRFGRDAIATVAKNYSYQRIGRCGDKDSACTVVAEAMLHYADRHGRGSDVAIINAGAVRGAIPSGKLTALDVYGRLLPFPIALCRIELPGSRIVEAIEGAIANALFQPGGTGSFPHTANLIFEYTAGEGRAVLENVQVRARGGSEFVPIEPSARYSVLVSSYMAKGKEGYGALADGEHHLFDALIADALVGYLRSGTAH
jgi:5'-nucleotidase